MIRTVVKWVLIAMLVLLAALWLYAGGFTQITRFVRTIPNPIDIIWGTSTSTYEVILPWQIDVPHGADIDALVQEGNAYVGSADERLAELERQDAEARRIQENAGRSPHYGKVALSIANARDGASGEYVVLSARTDTGVQITGWSLQSSLSGVRATIPFGAPLYAHGALNGVRAVVLERGMSAIVATRVSPVGVSFLENRCTGYLSQSQHFEPPLANACPAPAEQMPLTEENLLRYGGDCIDHIRTIPHCTSQTSAPASLSRACHAFIANTFTYTGCAQAHRSDASFFLDTWRLYLGFSQELWRNDHDVIRLVDEYGLLVASVTY